MTTPASTKPADPLALLVLAAILGVPIAGHPRHGERELGLPNGAELTAGLHFLLV